jgi:protein TonB
LLIESRSQGLRSRFLIGSLLLHLGLVFLLLKGLPVSPWADSPPDELSPPFIVTILDPDAVNELPIGPVTNLPPKPTNLELAPRSRAVPPAVAPALPADRAERTPLSEASRSETAVGDPAAPLLPESRGESARGGQEPPVVAPPVAPGLPFVNREEINRMAKLFTDEPRSPKEPYTVNTEDLQYLSYIAQIARTLELVWRYPREAGERGQQGVTVLKVVIREDGTLHAAQLVESSGYPLLDGEALRAVKRIAPYPPLPKIWRRAQWELTISFAYLLNGVAVGVI